MINAKAKEFKLDPMLISAMVQVESAGNPKAMRFEPAWRYFWFVDGYASKLNISVETERTLQAFSYGLLQIMGSCAREGGLTGPLTDLLNVEMSLHYGCMHLSKIAKKYGVEVDVIAAYNAGSPRKLASGMYENQAYVNKVHQYLVELRKLEP